MFSDAFSFTVHAEPDANSYEHNFARLERLLRNQDDVEEIPKVGYKYRYYYCKKFDSDIVQMIPCM